MPEAGLVLTNQRHVGAAATIALNDETPPSEVWATLANAEPFQAKLVDAVRDAAAGRTPGEFYDVLEEHDVDALHGAYATLAVRTAKGHRSAVYDLLRETRRLATGRSPFDDALAAARVFTLTDDVTPTVAINVADGFRDLRAGQRRDVCRLVAALGDGANVRLVATGRLQRWLVDAHRDDLPVSGENITSSSEGVLSDAVATARDGLDPDGFAVDVLRSVADEPSETLPYSALYAAYERGESRVRQVVGRLADLDLAERYDGAAGRTVGLLPAGREYLDVRDEEIGRQKTLQASVSDPGNSSSQSRVTPRMAEEGEEAVGGGTAADATPYRTRYLDRATHHATVAAAPDGGVALAGDDLRRDDGAEQRRTRGVSYDAGRDEAVVSVRATGALQYTVSVALALASPRFFDRALSVSRLEDDLDDPPAILRDARCMGAVSSDAVDDPQVLRDGLVEWGEELADMTTAHRREEYDDRDAHRSAIMRSAHGLAGTIAHLLDVVGVDLVREARVPGGLDRERNLQPLAKAVAVSAAIQSRYGAFATYRQLYEDREQKRAAALVPDVDAAAPTGRLIGSIVFRGPDLHRLEDAFGEALASPAPVHDDAPEFAVPVDVTAEAGRPAYAAVANRLLDTKNLDTRREAVSVLEAFTGSPYDAARALHALGGEEFPRDVRLEELRYALATLPTDRILPDAAPTVSKALHALLDTERPLSKAGLADRAGVSRRSLRTHLDRLVAFDVVREVAGGYRLALSTSEERHTDVLPWYATPNRQRDDYHDATEKGVLAWVYMDQNLPGSDAVEETMMDFVTYRVPERIRERIVDIWPWVGPLLEVVRAFAVEELEHRDPNHRTIAFGADIEQTALKTCGPCVDKPIASVVGR
jgi:hypothetical protein